MTGQQDVFNIPHLEAEVPLLDTRDVSNLLGRAGFTLLTVDIDEVKVMYPSMWELMDDLRDMGESNAVSDRQEISPMYPRLSLIYFPPRRLFLHRDTLLAASAAYQG